MGETSKTKIVTNLKKFKMWQKYKINRIVTQPKKSNCGKTKKRLKNYKAQDPKLWQNKEENSNCDQSKKTNRDKTQTASKHKTEIATKLKKKIKLR